MDEKLQEGVINRFFENDAIKLTFEITNQRITNIAIQVKDEELYPLVEVNDKRRMLNWLNNLSTYISQYLGSAPTQLVRKPEEDSLMETVPIECPRCKSKGLMMQGSCCGGKGEHMVCPNCNLKMKVRKSRQDENKPE